MMRWLRLPASVSLNYTKAILWAVLSGIIIYGAFIGYFSPNYKSGKFDYNAANWVMAENAYLRYYHYIPRDRDPRERVELKKGEQVVPLAGKFILSGKPLWLQVENASGDRGYISIDSLIPEIQADLANLPIIEPRAKLITTYETLAKNVLGKEISQIERRYGPTSSNIPLDEKTREVYYGNLNLTKDNMKYSGVFLVTGEDGRVVDMELNYSQKYTLEEKYPLAQFLRKNELFGLTGAYFVREPNPIIENLSAEYRRFIQRHWSTRILGFGLAFAWRFLSLSIPFFLIYPLKTLIYYNTRISNRLALWAYTILSALSFYLVTVYAGLLDGQVWVFTLIFGFLFFFWLIRELTHIHYNRCDYCNHMNLVAGKGSTFLGRIKSEQWGTYRESKGTTRRETETTIETTHHYDVRPEQTITTEDKYRDHRHCWNCDFEWDVPRSIVSRVVIRH